MKAKTTVKIGSRAEAESLFTYPNDGHETQSLEETIKHYVSDSLRREGLQIFSVDVRWTEVECLIEIECDGSDIADALGNCYQSFLDIGSVGHVAAENFKRTGNWDPAWKFLLPLGLPMAFARAVEIMDFPPLSLIKKQDYLDSKTTNRWWELLILNGVTEDEKARFTCILDIVPVAAPARDGKKLDESGIYDGPFDSYGFPLLQLLSRSRSVTPRPLIALGLPIRKWIQRNWNQTLNVLDVGAITVAPGESCAVISSNHPSFFYYAVTAYSGTPDAEKKNLAAGLAVMKQDIVAAAWHAEMGKKPESDATQVLATSQAKWADRDPELLALVKKQAGIAKVLRIELEMADIRDAMPTSEELARLEQQFHSGEFESPQ